MDWVQRSDHLASKFSQSDPLGFYLWGWLQEIVHVTEVWDHDDLIKCTEVAAAEIRNLPRQLVTIRVSVRCHCEAWVKEQGGHFEHLMWCTFSAHHMIRMYLKWGTLKWWIKNATRERIFFPSFFNSKQGDQLTCYVKKNCFYFVKTGNHNNTMRHQHRHSVIPNNGIPERNLLTFSALTDLPNSLLEDLLEVWINLYKS
jgi:hypothetical protein